MDKVSLPPMSTTFHIHVKGEETGVLREGDFTYTRPTLGKRIEISKMATRLNGDLVNLPLDIKFFNEMCATLYYCIENAPEWWNKTNGGRDFYDINVIQEIYSKCREFEDDWTKRVWGDKKEDVDVNKKEQVNES